MAMPLKAGKRTHCQALLDPFCSRLQGLGLCAVDQLGLPFWPVVLASHHAQVGSCSCGMVISSSKANMAPSQQQRELYLALWLCMGNSTSFLLLRQAFESVSVVSRK